jgi:hypothetical protein
MADGIPDAEGAIAPVLMVALPIAWDGAIDFSSQIPKKGIKSDPNTSKSRYFKLEIFKVDAALEFEFKHSRCKTWDFSLTF